MLKRVRESAVLIAFVGALAACARTDAAPERKSHGPPKVAAARSAPASRSMLEPGELKAIVSATVVGRTGPDGQPFEIALRTLPAQFGHSRRFGTRTLPIALRNGARELNNYPCTSCHMGRKMVLSDRRIDDAHQDVQPEHPKETGATCGSCHAADNVEMLSLLSGERASLDHAYRLCAQCHTPQLESWSKGAHGKRLDGWQGRRVVMNCTDCHDPHGPGLQTRLPFRPPQLHRKGSK